MRYARLVSAHALILSLGVCIQASADDTSSDKWHSLMDGKTTAGWHAVGHGRWTFEDGAFVGRANNEKLYGLLVSDRMYRDFEVRFQFQCLSGDSGFYIRTVIKEPEQAHGLQVQVGRTKSGVGGIYESYGRRWVSKPSDEFEASYTRDDQWNEMRIRAVGGDVSVHVNGVKSAELKDDEGRAEGHLALQMHSGNVMEIRFREIQIRELPQR